MPVTGAYRGNGQNACDMAFTIPFCPFIYIVIFTEVKAVSTIHISKTDNYFTVENSFVDKYMCDANGYFVKVYLYLLRHSADKSDLSLSKIADVLNMLQSDVLSALKYWDSLGVIKFVQKDKNDYDIDLSYRADTAMEAQSPQPVKAEDETVETPKQVMRTSPTYQMSEINNIIMGNEKIKGMFNIASQILNKTLSSNDMKIIYSFYDYLKLPVEVIFLLLEYCVTVDKTNMRYMEKVAIGWADDEINTTRKANNYIKQKTLENNLISKYRKMFKINDRDLSDTETSYIKKWVNEYKCTEEQIFDAYNKTVLNTGKVAFKYMDAILKNSGEEKDNGNKANPIETKKGKNSFNGYSANYGNTELEKELLNRRMAKYKTLEE